MTGKGLKEYRESGGKTVDELADSLGVPGSMIRIFEAHGLAATLPTYLNKRIVAMQNGTAKKTKRRPRNRTFKQNIEYTQRVLNITRLELATALHTTPEALRELMDNPHKDNHRLIGRMKTWRDQGRLPDPEISKARTLSMKAYHEKTRGLTQSQQEIKDTFDSVMVDWVDPIRGDVRPVDETPSPTGFHRMAHRVGGGYIKALMEATHSTPEDIANITGVSIDRINYVLRDNRMKLTQQEKISIKELGIWVQDNGGSSLPVISEPMQEAPVDLPKQQQKETTAPTIKSQRGLDLGPYWIGIGGFLGGLTGASVVLAALKIYNG